MSKQIDNLLDSLIKEIDAQDPSPKEEQAEPKPASREAVKKAEAIAKGVNQSYRRPPEPVKTSIPAPKIKPVVEPEPTSHFSEEPSSDPAIRMHDRLDESTLPAPDAERRPNRILRGKKHRKGTRSIPEPAQAPKRKIPHINVPDELPPDVANEPVKIAEPEPDAEREALVRNRAEKIREQLKKRTLEQTPIIAPPSEEEINEMLDDLENPDKNAENAETPAQEGDSIFAYLHQVLGVEEEEETPDEPEQTEEAPADSRPRWFDDAPSPVPMSAQADGDEDEYDDYDEYDEELQDEQSLVEDAEEDFAEFEEPEEKPENPIARFFKNLFGKRTEPEDISDEDEEFDELNDDEDYEEFDEDESFADEPPATEVPIPEDEEDYPAPPVPQKSAPAPKPVEESAPVEETEEDFAEEEPVEDDFEEPVEDEFEDESAEEFEGEDFEDEALDEEPVEETPRQQRTGFFREALDESAEELAEIKAEPIPHPAAETPKTRFLGRNAYFVAGVLVFLLALVGLITLITYIAKATSGFFSGGSLRTQLESSLYPLAVVDVPAFNEPAELTADGALSAAIVDILMHDDLSGYTESFDMISVPADDVLERGRQMFGVDVQTQLDTLHAAGESFVYDATTGCYNVPVSPMIFSYYPEVKNVQRTGDTYEVTVIFHSDVANWQENSKNFTEGSSKTMQATVEKKNTGYRIVRLVPVE